jgi:hypothetical protein
LGGSTTVDLLLQWAPLDAVAQFGAPTLTIALASVLFVKGHKGFGREREGGEKSVHNVGADREIGCPEFFDVVCSTPYFSMKKYGGGHYVNMLLD